MTIPLLRTNLHIPPIRPELVPRLRLIEQLNARLPRQSGARATHGFARRLTLISAPAGFGKTTLVSSWLHQLAVAQMASSAPPHASSSAPPPLRSPAQAAWRSLDEADNDLARFLTYLIAALQTVETAIGKGTVSALQSPQPPPAETVLTSLINEVATFPDRIVLVLDDYHLIEAQPIQEAQEGDDPRV